MGYKKTRYLNGYTKTKIIEKIRMINDGGTNDKL